MNAFAIDWFHSVHPCDNGYHQNDTARLVDYLLMLCMAGNDGLSCHIRETPFLLTDGERLGNAFKKPIHEYSIVSVRGVAWLK